MPTEVPPRLVGMGKEETSVSVEGPRFFPKITIIEPPAGSLPRVFGSL
jgi:hypothetical protein